jgi:hypothetical protein
MDLKCEKPAIVFLGHVLQQTSEFHDLGMIRTVHIFRKQIDFNEPHGAPTPP